MEQKQGDFIVDSRLRFRACWLTNGNRDGKGVVEMVRSKGAMRCRSLQHEHIMSLDLTLVLLACRPSPLSKALGSYQMHQMMRVS